MSMSRLREIDLILTQEENNNRHIDRIETMLIFPIQYCPSLGLRVHERPELYGKRQKGCIIKRVQAKRKNSIRKGIIRDVPALPISAMHVDIKGSLCQ